jgi:hypothetical protein
MRCQSVIFRSYNFPLECFQLTSSVLLEVVSALLNFLLSNHRQGRINRLPLLRVFLNHTLVDGLPRPKSFDDVVETFSAIGDHVFFRAVLLRQ